MRMLLKLRCELLSKLYLVLGFTGESLNDNDEYRCELLSKLYLVLGFTGKGDIIAAMNSL